MFTRFFRALESTQMTIGGWVGAFMCVVMVRTFLENFSGRIDVSLITSDSQTIIHYTIFYLLTLLTLLTILHHATGKKVAEVGKVLIFGFLVILTPPVVDLLISRGAGIEMGYLFGNKGELWQYFSTFFTATSLPGITYGIRLEFALILFTVFAYVRYAGQPVWRALLTVIVVFCALFCLIAAPSFLPMGSNFGVFLSIQTTLLGVTFIRPDVTFSSFDRAYEMYFNGALAQVGYILLSGLIPYLSYRLSPKKWLAVFSNSRPERVFHYFLMVALGIFLASRLGLASFLPLTFFDVTTLIILFLSFYFAWMFAVGTNDIVDATSDALTNSTRPLVTGALTVAEVRTANTLFLVAAILGGYLAGHVALYMVLTFTAIYYMYSCPPLHLKRFPGINAVCIALATLCTVVAGFYTVSQDPTIGVFPTKILILIIVLYTCLANIKDLKDIEGDAKVGVYTIPVLFGAVWGRTVVWLLVCLGLSFVPLVLENVFFWIPTALTCALSYLIIHRKPFKEKPLFILYFVHLFALCALSLL